MDRKIKFRAYLKNYNEIYEVISIDFSNEEVLVTNKDNDEVIVCFEDIVLLQYTGLKDKNGKEIYEGDIVMNDKVYTDEYGTPIIRIGEFKDYLLDIDDIFYGVYFYFHNNERTVGIDPNYIKDFEVIGNIYENEDLINNI